MWKLCNYVVTVYNLRVEENSSQIIIIEINQPLSVQNVTEFDMTSNPFLSLLLILIFKYWQFCMKQYNVQRLSGFEHSETAYHSDILFWNFSEEHGHQLLQFFLNKWICHSVSVDIDISMFTSIMTQNFTCISCCQISWKIWSWIWCSHTVIIEYKNAEMNSKNSTLTSWLKCTGWFH